MRPRALFLSAALAAIAWTPSLAQSNRQSTRLGIIAGANLATLSGSFFPKASKRTGFAGGLMAVLPVAPSFAIQPELMFTMKGANSDSGGFSATAKIYYVEVPVLARLEIPAYGRLKPFVYGGPSFAYRTSCTLAGHSAAGAFMVDPVDITVACDSLTSRPYPPTPGVKYTRTDVNGIIGAGLAFNVGGNTVTGSVRYDVGFVKVVTFNDSKNRVSSFIGTVEWPLHN